MIPVGFLNAAGGFSLSAFNSSTMAELAIWESQADSGTSIIAAGWNGLNARINRSTNNGQTWSAITSPVALLWRHVAYGNGLYVIATGANDGASNGRLIYSNNNGSSFTLVTVGTADITGLLFDGTRFLTSQSNTVTHSTNATSWTSTGTISNLGDRWAKNDSIYVAMKSAGTATPSTSAICTSDPTVTANWTTFSFPLSGANTSYVIAGNGIFMAGSNDVNTYYTSSNGTTWTSRTFPVTITGSAGFASNLFWIKATTTNVVYSSPDGITWTSTGLNTNRPGRTLTWLGNELTLIQNGTTTTTTPTDLASYSS